MVMAGSGVQYGVDLGAGQLPSVPHGVTPFRADEGGASGGDDAGTGLIGVRRLITCRVDLLFPYYREFTEE